MQFTYLNGTFGYTRDETRWKALGLAFGTNQVIQKVYSDYLFGPGLNPPYDPVKEIQLSEDETTAPEHYRTNFEFPPEPADDAHAWSTSGLYCEHIRWAIVLGGKMGTTELPGSHTFFWRAVPLRGRRGRLQPLAEGARPL